MTEFADGQGRRWRFDEADRIGDASGVGHVFCGVSGDGTAVAVKRVRLPDLSRRTERRRERELEVTGELLRAERAGLPVDRLVLPLAWCFDDDDLYLVMPLAEGSLQAAAEAGQVDPFDAFRQVTLGLEQLAALSVLHRDIKPANVLRYGPTWKLTDFGLSRLLFESPATYTFTRSGTPIYNAPEIWQGQSATVKSDLYALGVLAYQLYAGHPPFDGDDLERRHRTEAPPPLGAHVPAKVNRLIMRLLRKLPAERPQDARAVTEVLDSCAERLTPDETALARAALAREHREHGRTAAEQVAAAASRSDRDARDQAASDLAETLTEAADSVRRAFPDAVIDVDKGRFALDALAVTFATAEPLRLGNQNDGRVLSGTVRATSPGADVHLATLSYQREPDGRMRWWWFGPDLLTPTRHRLTPESVVTLLTAAVEAA
ncbi:serine/threonine-protein kinase [Dactylosporangium sp. AC04546]|uniref:serine/threonine-protein kinase n=1 Tax=Dactylosporangium sp. AC04546 TaxID=2862460 RepID=UPI001EDD60CA|nr:serine/threonine-protein kinase [Dactylosporangium sp. AC04546]WVK80046.1 serine/threonine-protein kinase [Dactylosporangium sp. AC04546]